MPDKMPEFRGDRLTIGIRGELARNTTETTRQFEKDANRIVR